VVGCLDDGPEPGGLGAPPVLGGLRDLPALIATGGVERVLVAFTRHRDESVLATLRQCDLRGVEVEVVPRLFELVGLAPPTRNLGRVPLLGVPAAGPAPVRRALKHGMDIAIAAVAGLLLLPLLALSVLAILIELGRPALFRQARAGRDGRPFTIWKLRTMPVRAEPGPADVPAADDAGLAIANLSAWLKSSGASEASRVGRVLRRFSLDELPQLWNVLRGDMSIVGPRPLPLIEAAGVEPRHRLRFSVRPGLTGLWQVMGRSDIPWPERMELDDSYVRHWSLALDLRILAATLRVVVRGLGAR